MIPVVGVVIWAIGMVVTFWVLTFMDAWTDSDADVGKSSIAAAIWPFVVAGILVYLFMAWPGMLGRHLRRRGAR